jgi:hypothetical protein
MSNPELLESWRERLLDFSQSEMTVQAWCDFSRVSLHQYYYWRRRIASIDARNHTTGPSADQRQFSSSPVSNRSFVPVSILSESSGSITVQIAGASIELQAGFDPALLRSVVFALGSQTC